MTVSLFFRALAFSIPIVFAGFAHAANTFGVKCGPSAIQKKNTLQGLVNHTFNGGSRFQTDALLVQVEGQTRLECYSNGYHRHKKHALWSLGKVITNTIVGAAEYKGFVSRAESVDRLVPIPNLTMDHLLRMQSGIDWIEQHSESLAKSHSFDLFYSKVSHKNVAEFILSFSRSAKPGQSFNYSTADSLLSLFVLRKKLGDSRFEQFVFDNLLPALDIPNLTIERDTAGNLLLPWASWGTATDMLKIGELYLNRGVTNGRRVFSNRWYQDSITPSPAPNQIDGSENAQNIPLLKSFGSQIWTNQPYMDGSQQKSPFAELPEDSLLSFAGRGQFLLIIPSKQVVVVRLATHNEPSNKKRAEYNLKFRKLLMEAIK